MRPRMIALALISIGPLMGCATQSLLSLPDPIGPEIAQVNAGEAQGELVVYSPSRVSVVDQSEYPVHTPYTIYSLNDQVVKRVRNVSGLFNREPERVSLPQGSYRVKALNTGPGEVIVTVIISSGKTTVVDLDGSALPQDKQGHWVRLPDGTGKHEGRSLLIAFLMWLSCVINVHVFS